MRVLDPVWITLNDGCRLAARIWVPDDAVRSPAPAILEAIPYRRTNGTLAADEPRYTWWAERGFVGVRVDIRGSGDSDGLITDEYLRQEQDDAVEVIAWLAAQAWCNGRVGMIGYSWGGFAGLQVAARRPPELGAVVTINSVVRRYTDDCHYTGGRVNAHDLLSWATTMLAYDARPPDPAIVGERWRESWLKRLDVAPPMIEPWLTHQLEDDYWRHGSVCFDYEAIQCAVLAVGGWADPYRNAVLDLVEHLPRDGYGLLGPWAHGYPHATPPGPAIGFLTECARFFGRYLRDDPNDYEREPALRAYLQEFDRPAAFHHVRSGRWVGVASWPSSTGSHELSLGDRTLGTDDAEPTTLTAPSVQSTGLAAGNWCPYGGPSEPLDQRRDDGLSLCFDGPVLAEAVETLGFPLLRLRVASDRPDAFVAARLCDVAPSGESLLVTRGILDLTHREGHDHVAPVTPGDAMEVELRLDCAGHRFAPGHRIRLALSPCYWPWIWPSREEATLTIETAGCQLLLPEVGTVTKVDLGPPEEVTAVDVEWLEANTSGRVFSYDATADTYELVSLSEDGGRRRIVALDLEADDWGENVYRIGNGAPLSAEVICRRRAGIGREGWNVSIEVEARMTSTADEFVVETELSAKENGAEVLSRRFESRVRRPQAMS